MLSCFGNPSGPTTIRAGRPTDLDRMVSLHVAVWRETYRHLAPADAFQRLDETARRPRWMEALRDGSTLVASVRSEIVGLAHVSPPGHTAFGERGEIKHLYVGAAWSRRGIGRQLLATARRLLHERGYPAAALGVVIGNEPALRFYEAQGGCVIGRYRDPGPIWPSENFVVAWDHTCPQA